MINYLITVLIKAVILFIQNTYGSIIYPYKTYRRLAKSKRYEQLLPLLALVVLYFWWASAVRVGIRHPLILTKNWILTSFSAALTFLLIIGGIYIIGRAIGPAPHRVQGSGIGNILLPWAYSLLPTLLWFYINSLSFFILRPPRTESLLGQLFSFLFIVGSLSLFFWKGILYYLTLRFGMRLDLPKILLSSAIIFPAGIGYSILMYKLGIFRIPFI
jgi:hypothetical protein